MTTKFDIKRAQCYIDLFIHDFETKNAESIIERPSTMLEEIEWIFDELLHIHGILDKAEIPSHGMDGNEFSLSDRIEWLITGTSRMDCVPNHSQYQLREDRSSYDDDPVPGVDPSLAGIIEVRIRSTKPPWCYLDWTDIPSKKYICSPEDVIPFTRVLFNNLSYATELRWNWEGSLQGHYLKPRGAP